MRFIHNMAEGEDASLEIFPAEGIGLLGQGTKVSFQKKR